MRAGAGRGIYRKLPKSLVQSKLRQRKTTHCPFHLERQIKEATSAVNDDPTRQCKITSGMAMKCVKWYHSSKKYLFLAAKTLCLVW